MVPIKSPDISISSGISGAFITVVLYKLEPYDCPWETAQYLR